MKKKIRKLLNNRGFTLPETLIAFLLVSMIIIWVTQAVPGIRYKNNLENNRMVALMKNMEVMEVTRKHLNESGEIKRLSSKELTGEEYGTGVFYSTVYEKFESATGGDLGGSDNKSIKNILNSVLDVDKHPELAELLPRHGGTSELYLVGLNTTVARDKFKRTELTSFLYTNISPNSNIKHEDMGLWLSAEGKSNFDKDNSEWKDLSGTGSRKKLVNFNFSATSGWTGRSLLYDGIDDIVNLGNGVEMKPEKFSIELYIRPENTGRRHVTFVNWGGVVGGSSGYTVEILANGSVAFGLNSTKPYLTTSKKLKWDRYTHIVATYDGESQNIYINGELEATEKYTNKMGYSTESNTYISSPEYDKFKGNIQEVRMYGVPLSPGEVKRNYTATEGGN